MADKKKKINSALSAAGRAASKANSNVADQLKKKKKSAQQAAQMQESQKKLPSWYGSIDTSRPRVQQRSITSTAKGRSVFVPQQQTTTQTASPAGSMWPIVPKKTSAGLPSLAQVYGAPYRGDFAAYLPSRRGQGTLEPSDVTGAHYAEWMSDMADQKAFDEYRQQMVQSAKPQMKYQQHYNFETDRKRVERLEYQLRFENDPEERQRMQGEIDTILAGAGTHSHEANEYARQYYQEKQDRADRSAARARARASMYMTAADTDRATGADVPALDVDEGRRRIEEGLAEARRTGNQVLISTYEKALESYDANPEQYAGLVMNENERKAYAASTAAEEQDTDSRIARAGVYQSKANQYYLDMDRRFGFTAASQQPDFKEQSKAPKKEFTYPKAITVNGNPMLINQPFEDDYHWDYMTDEEKATAIYLFNTKGEGTAKAYIFDYLGPGIDKVYAQDQQAKIYDEVSGASGLEKALYSGASVLTNAVYAPMSYLNNAGQVVGNLIADKRGVGWTPVNSYSEFSRAARNTRISRQAVADSMGSVGAFFYQTGMSMLDNMILLPTGQTGTLGLMALEAADAQYAEDIDNGVDPETAAISGAIAGGIETLTETVSLEHLFKAPDVESFLRGLGKQALFEGSEEGASDVLNLIRERALYGETSYGTTEEEHKAWFRQLLLDIAGGAVAGAGMYAGYGGPQYVARRIGETKAAGQQVLANDNGAALAQAYTDATGKPANAPRSVFQTGRVLQKTLNQGAKNYNATYAQETGDAAVQYYQDNQPKDQEADKKASETVYAAIRKALADKKLTRQEQAAMDSIPGVREAVAAYRNGGSMEGTVNREGSAKIKRGMENALLSVDHNLQSAGLDSNVETDIKASERMQQTAQGVQDAAQERKAMMQMREGENAQSQVDGQDVELLGMTGVGDKATLNVRGQDGQVQEVSLNDVTYGSDRKATAYAIGADMENTALANSFVATLADNQVPARVAAGMQAAYDYAYGGAPSVESLKGSILTEGLNDAQLNRAFELGQQARQSAVQVAQEIKMKQALKQANVEWKGGTVDTSKVDMANLNAEQQRQVNLVQLVAGVTGINVELFQSKADANGRYRGENGSYNAATNTIRLDVNAGAYNAGELSQVTLLRTMSHELTHALQQNSPAQYEALKHAVLDVLTSKSGASIEEMAARKMEQDSSLKKADVALDEVVAEACENMLRDSNAMEQLIAQHPAEAKTFLEKMKQFFTDIVNAIRAAFGGSGTSRSREATALMQQAEEYLDICEKWSKALQDAAEISGRMDRQTGDGDMSERFDKGNEDIRFSLRENVEQTKDLVAVHNLTEKNLLDALNLGGLPSPSIAIVKAKNGHSKYGPISLVFDKSSIDPQVKGNRVYGSDAWTPTSPKVEVEANDQAATRLRNKYYELARQVGYDKARPFYPYANELEESLNRNGGEAGIIENHLDDTNMMNLFLADTGRSMVEDISKETVTRIPEEKVQLYEALISGMGEDIIRELYPVNYESPMETRRRWLENHGEQLERVYLEYASENGIDTQDFAVKRLMPQLVQARNYLANGAETRTTEFDPEATDMAIRSAVNQKEYAAWLHQLFDGAEGRKGIYNGKDVVDSRGNRRTWNQLHYTYTLENIVKAMNTVQSARGQGIWGANATGLQALASSEYKNISEIKADSSRLGAVDEATYAERVQTVDQAIGRIISKISGGSNSLMENDNVATALKSAALTTKTVNAIVKSFAQDGYTIDTQTAKEIQNIYKAASAIPTEYFEAKPQRAVYFDEVKYAVVPDNLNPDVLSRLEALVPDVRTYADGDEAQRLELLNQRQDLRFQMRDDDGGAQGLVGMFDEVPRLGEAHIDQRTWDNMSDRRVHSFMNDYPASRMWLARMASILQSDVTASTAGQRFMNEEGTFMGQKRDTTPLLSEMKDSGYTWQQMSDVFGKMAEVFENGDLEGKVPETAIWKRAELILDRAVTEGYTDMNGIEYRPDAGYMRYKDALPGAKAREIPANAVEDTFEDVDNRLAGGGNAAAQTGGDGERVQLQGDTSYQEKQQSAKSGIALMDGGPSNRELLSSALESAAQTPEELRYVQSYKKQAQKIAEMEGLLAERRAEVQQLQGMKKRTADQEIRMKNLQTSIAETESMIDKRDKGLLKMEAMEPLRNVLDRERANYRETLKQAKKDAAARQREKDAAKLDDALLATQMHEGREWAAKLHEAENRVAEANQKVEDLKAQSLADRMHESSEWAAKLRKAEDQLTAAKRQLETAKMQRIAERIAEGRKWAEKFRQAKEQADRRAARLREQADRRVEKIQDKADRRTLQGKIIRRVKALDTMLRTPSNTRHVPDALRGATANILQYFTDESKIFKAEDMQAAANAYAALNTEENSNMAEGMYDPDTYDRMVALMEVTKKGQSLKNLSMDELTMVDKVLQNLSHIIQNANAVFVNGKRRNLEELVNEEQQTLQEKGRYGSFTLKDNAFVDMLRRGNITAPYFFKHLGGPLGELGTAILNGETAFGVETGRATERFRAIEEKYHRDAWKNKKGDTLTLKNGDGDKIQLTREQAMSVWATWKREHSIADRETHHLDQGGILLQQEKKLFKKTYAQDSAFRINTAEMVEIDKWLTQEQKNYVDEVVSYLSTDIAELGNITSNALHGYSKFGEGYYYPFRTSDEFRPTKIGKDENAMPLKLMGFTKSVRSKSNAPVIVTEFTSTASDHINSMLTYYAFAEAQDNFMRLYNFRMDQNHSIKRSLSGAYGANPGKFIRAFMNDMYGGVGMSMNEREANRFLGAFKKGAVMASLSVAIQQSSSIMRAMALIDPKYFVGKPLKGGFAEAKKYAGTAVIKDMGSFDTSTGRSAVQYITGDGAKTAYGKFSEKVGDVGGWLPEKMDAITWGRMWSAVKRETAARTGLNVNSEELKVQAGKRFDEVMRLTQVYDSTLAKSELMREKNMWAKMVTAFMAEATVTYNMLMDAVIDAKGKRFGAATKSVGSVIAATILNTLLSSVIYAMRDDDDKDATYFERYVKSVVGGLDPIDVTLNLVPMVKDVYEIFRGYDVERTDMSVFNDIYTYSKVLSNPDKSWLDRLKSGVSLAGIITGIPAKNIWRDIEGTVNTFKTVKDTDYRDGAAKMAALQGLSEWAFGPDVSETATIDKLVQAMAKGDQSEAAAQMKTLSTFYEGDEKKRKTAIKKAGKEAYIDGDLTDAQALRVLEGIGITGDEADKVLLDWQYGKKTGGKTVGGAVSDYLEGEIDRETALDALARTGAEEEDVETRMRKLDYQKESGISYSGLQDAYTDGRISRAEALRVRAEIGGQKPDEAEKTLLQWDYEKDTGRKWADMQKDYAAGTITDKQAVDYLVKYGDKKADAASETVTRWKYEKSTGKKWDEMQDDYLDGSLTKAQAMSAMQKYGGKTEAEAYWTVDEWDYREANPDADGYSKFHRVTELAGRGQSISGAVKEIYAHSDYKTAKDCGSAVTSALTSYWKPLYLAATPAQREELEPIMLAAYRAAYETLGEVYYGDKRRLKAIRKWLED